MKGNLHMRSKKRTAAVTAGVLAASILLTGTFAWRSMNQQAKNEIVHSVNPGGRLHDDFDGENKNVYVENFMSVAQGGQPIFARVRLDEYLEYGEDAGTRIGETGRDATSLVSTAKIDDVKTWTTHIPAADDPAKDPAAEGRESFHDYWTWELGGQTVYMPTFNKNVDSLSADINGTWAGKDGVPFDDHTAWERDAVLTADAYYDKDDNPDDEYDPDDPAGHVPGGGGDEGTNYYTKEETHTAQDTLVTEDVLTMDQWEAMGSPMGPYWVYDTDGWAYWAQAIQPGTATGPLLSRIEWNRGEDTTPCYYGINVVGQFATAGEWGKPADGDTPASGFYDPNEGGTGISDRALFLLKQAAGIKYELEITGEDGVIDGTEPVALAPGGTMDFSVSVTVDGAASSQGKDVTWTVTGGTKAGTKIEPMSFSTLRARAAVTYGARLTIDPDEPEGAQLTVRAETWNHQRKEFKVTVAAAEPTPTPTTEPTETPTETPTESPTETPTETPSETPTESPSETPTETPTETPSKTPAEPTTEPAPEETTTPENTDPPVTPAAPPPAEDQP